MVLCIINICTWHGNFCPRVPADPYFCALPDDKMRKLHNEFTSMAEKVSPTGKNKLKVGVSWAQVVDDCVPAIPTIATGDQISSSACEIAKTKHLPLK